MCRGNILGPLLLLGATCFPFSFGINIYAKPVARPLNGTHVELLELARGVGPEYPIWDGRDLFEGLRQQSCNSTFILQQNITLDDPIWDSLESPFYVADNCVLVFKAPLDGGVQGIYTDPLVITHAGGNVLNLSRREGLFDVAGVIAFSGIAVKGIASIAEYHAQQENSFVYPYGFSLFPSVKCIPPACIVVHNNTSVDYNPFDIAEQVVACQHDDLRSAVFRFGIAVGDPARVGLSNDSTIFIAGDADLTFNMVNSTDVTESLGSVRVIVNNTVRGCVDDPYMLALGSMNAEIKLGSDGGTPAWVWVIVALAAAIATAIAVFGALWFTRGRRAKGLDVEAGTISNQSSMDKKPSNFEDGQAIHQLKEGWRTRIGDVHGLQFLEVIGRGGSASVFRARWKGAIVAVKVVEHQLSDDIMRQLKREAALCTSVSHPNLITTYKVCCSKLSDVLRLQSSMGNDPLRKYGTRDVEATAVELDGITTPKLSPEGIDEDSMGPATPPLGSHNSSLVSLPSDIRGGETVDPDAVLYSTLIIMEYADKGSAEDCMLSRSLLYDPISGRPDVPSILRILIDAALGLDYLHSVAKVLHQDIKAANILLKSVGHNKRGYCAKLTDFGVARMLESDRPTLISGEMAGTLTHMAPELLMGKRATTSTDVYSFSMLMLELYTGHQAFQGETHTLLTLQQKVGQGGERPTIPPDMPSGYSHIMEACWSQDPQNRPSFEVLVSQLRQLLLELLD